MTRYFTVAEHTFAVEAQESLLETMRNYEPFRVEAGSEAGTEPSLLFSLKVTKGQAPAYIEELRQEDEGQDIFCGHTEQGEPVFETRWNATSAGCFVCKPDYSSAVLHLTGYMSKAALDNALMIIYAMASACRDTALFHAAVVSFKGKGYMFLGKSGTGKSTHARLWLKYIPGAELMNDDNPVVRVLPDGSAMVYGSPWSGKTPCYRNVSCPVGGIVALSQAPHNEIVRLTGIAAYAAVVPSISGKRWDRTIADGLHHTENALAGNVPVWHLDCLPDEAAALLCNDTVTK